MSSLFCFMHFMWRYHGSKGVPDIIVEDAVLGNMATPGDLEESASHHWVLGNLEPPGDLEESASQHFA